MGIVTVHVTGGHHNGRPEEIDQTESRLPGRAAARLIWF
jgi:hypothetical protein